MARVVREMSKAQIDRLGDRLRKGNISDDDLRLLDAYRRSFSEAYEIVIETIRKDLTLEPTGRPAKSTTSISDKLRRESIRLTQIQDIAGCRLIASDIANQDSVVQSLNSLFEDATIVDRRKKPSHGYRAVHVIVNSRGKMIEIQVRTALQHLWAELSEKFSDIGDSAIKYGGGDAIVQKALMNSSPTIAYVESLEVKVADAHMKSSQNKFTNEKKKQLAEVQEGLNLLRDEMHKYFSDEIKNLEKIKRGKDDLSD